MVTIEKLARLRAEMEAGAERDDVLRRESLTPAQWLAAQRRWLRAMAQELDRGEGGIAGQYLAAYTLASGQDGSAVAVPSAEGTAANPRPPAQPGAPRQALMPTGVTSHPPPAVATAAPAAAALPPEPAPVAPPPAQDIDATGELQLDFLTKAPLPFAPAPHSPAPAAHAGQVPPGHGRRPGESADGAEPAIAPTAPDRRADEAKRFGETMELDPSTLGALVFPKSVPFGPAPGAAENRTPSIDSTLPYERPASLLASPATPFTPDPAAKPPPRAEIEPSPAIGETAELSPAAIERIRRGLASPFDRAPACAAPFARASDRTPTRGAQGAGPPDPDHPFRSSELTIQQFAAVRVESELDPSKVEQVLAQYGLTRDANMALDEELRAACARQPAVAKAWEKAYETYLAWKRQGAR